MIQLATKDISEASQDVLKSLQKAVADETNFTLKAKKAKDLWNSKSSSKLKKKCFNEIKDTLEGMCVSVQICNYCEQSEANDIEHIHPKSFFPNLTFKWTNYLLACKQCNSGEKLDKCYIIDNQNTAHVLPRGIEPLVGPIAFINPRLEDPNKFMLLDLGSNGIEGTWEYMLVPGLSPLDIHKAKKTIDILNLNSRVPLIHARKNAAIFYFERIDRLVKILETNSMDELRKILTPYDKEGINLSLSLDDNKNIIKSGYRRDIQTHQHPSVWYSIKEIQSKIDIQWKNFFVKIPEALNW